MTATEMAALVGQVVTVTIESFHVECKIHDLKPAYGMILLLVEPVRVSGCQWVDIGRLVRDEPNQVELGRC